MTRNFSELAKFEWYEVALGNASSNPKLVESLNQIGVSQEVLKKGIKLQGIAKKAFEEANAARANRIAAYNVMKKKTDILSEYFSLDRKRSRIACISNELAMHKLELHKAVEKERLRQFEMTKIFYSVLSENPDLQELLANLGLSAEDIKTRLALTEEVGQARVNYVLHKGISQSATNKKRKAINTLTKWMSQFFAISKDALKEDPQMLEALGMIVKN